MFLYIMEAKLQQTIIDYFWCFEEFHTAAKTCLNKCQSCAASINKLIKRCKNIKEAVVTGTPLEKFEGLQTKLCVSIHNLISEEIREIRSRLSTLEDLFEKLCNKNNTLRDNCKEIDIQQNTALIRGTPLQPPLNVLLGFAEDTITFASQICAQIDTSLKILSVKELNTDSLVDNFSFPVAWQRRTAEIISYTSFLSENQL